MEKIAILRWESGHVPQGLMQLEQLPGNSTNPASYPFPVKLVEVKGANTDTVILHPSQKLLEDMIQLAKELEKEGVRAITTSCGFNAIFQEALANAVKIPVIGMGGIMTAEDALEFILAGATAVSIGTANFINPDTTIQVIEGIEAYMKKYGVEDIHELIGAVH